MFPTSNPIREQAISAALALADKGRAVFPMNRHKRPTCPHGVKDATTDPDVIRRQFAAGGTALVAVATGTPSGISVLDIDRQHNGAAWWSANRARLPQTFAYRSRGGGMHLWFVHRAGLRCSTSAVAPGLDVRAEGGSAIYWPATGLPILSDADPATWPEWLEPPARPAWTLPPAPSWTGDDRRARRYAEAAMTRAVQAVAGAREGTRNGLLFREAAGLLRLVETGGATTAEIAEAMAHAALAAGLPSREVQATLISALRAAGARA